MGYALQRIPQPAQLAAAFEGQQAELVELNYRDQSDAMRLGSAQQRATDGLLAASLHVDGQPVGFEALMNLPGRYSALIARALSACLRLHGLVDEDDAAAQAVEGTDAPKH